MDDLTTPEPSAQGANIGGVMQGAPPPQPSLFKQYIRSKFGLPDPQQQADQRAYRQQAAIEHFTNQLQQEEKAAQEWGDKALTQNKVVGETESLLARLPPNARATKDVQARLAREQQIFQMLSGNAQSHAQRADLFSQQIPGMIAHSQPPSMGQAAGGKAGKAGKPSMPTQPPRDTSYEQPSYSSPKEDRGAPTSGPQPTGVAADMAMEEPRLDDVNWWSGELHSIGFPEAPQVIDETLHYSVSTDDEAEQLRGKLKSVQDKLTDEAGEPIQIPAVVTSREGVFKQGMAVASQLASQELSLRQRLAQYDLLEQTPGDVDALIRMAGSATSTEEANNFISIKKASEQDRVKLIRAAKKPLVDEAERIAKQRKGLDAAFQGFQTDQLSQALKLAGVTPAGESPFTPAGPIPPANAGKALSQADFFVQYATDHKWTAPLSTKQIAEMREAYRASIQR
jgi:hypothetical protein